MTTTRPLSIAIRLLASVDPIGIDVDRFAQIVNGRIVHLAAHAAANRGGLAIAIHLHFARLLVIAKGAVELRVERTGELARTLHFGALRLALAHCSFGSALAAIESSEMAWTK